MLGAWNLENPPTAQPRRCRCSTWRRSSNKFKRLGFIEYSDETLFRINSSLLSVVLHD